MNYSYDDSTCNVKSLSSELEYLSRHKEITQINS